MIIGAYDPIKIRNHDHEYSLSSGPYHSNNSLSVTWTDLINTHFWSLPLVSVRIGNIELPLSTNVAIVDSGSSYLLMPQGKIYFINVIIADFRLFQRVLSQNAICGTDSKYNLFTCLCDSIKKYPDLKI